MQPHRAHPPYVEPNPPPVSVQIVPPSLIPPIRNCSDIYNTSKQLAERRQATNTCFSQYYPSWKGLKDALDTCNQAFASNSPSLLFCRCQYHFEPVVNSTAMPPSM